MSRSGEVRGNLLFDARLQHQADISFIKSNPVQNTWYTVLNTTANVRLYAVMIRIAVTGENLDIRITIDGQTYALGSTAIAANIWNYIYHFLTSAQLMNSTTVTLPMTYTFWEGRVVNIEIRKTTAAGTGNLLCNVIWARM